MKTLQPEDNTSPVTQKDIARVAGVSTTVVSYVINDGPRPVAPETRARVLKAIDKLGYRPNKFAQGLKSKGDPAHRQLGVIIGGGSDFFKRSYYSDILAGIYDEAYRQGQRIRFLHFFEELRDPVLFNEHVHPEEISALLFFPMNLLLEESENQALFHRIVERVDNIVCLEKSVADLPAVIFDRAGAARLAITHLIALGHQRIGFIGAREERTIGYQHALLEHNLPYDDTLVIHPGMYNTPAEGYSGGLQLLEAAVRPTAIFAECDEVAIGVLSALHDRGITVPDDIAVVSVDDIELAAMVRPALTTVRIPRQQMGIHALRMLMAHETYPDSHPASTVLHTELVVRQSCGSPGTR